MDERKPTKTEEATLRRLSDDETDNYRGLAEYDQISDVGRAALRARERSK